MADEAGPSGLPPDTGQPWQLAGKDGRAAKRSEERMDESGGARDADGAANAAPNAAPAPAPRRAGGAGRARVVLAKVTGEAAASILRVMEPRGTLTGGLRIVLGASGQPRPDLWASALHEHLLAGVVGASVVCGGARVVRGFEGVRFLPVTIEAPASDCAKISADLLAGLGFCTVFLPMHAMPGHMVSATFTLARSAECQLVRISMVQGPCAPEQVAAMLASAQEGVPGLRVHWVGVVSRGPGASVSPQVSQRFSVSSPPTPLEPVGGLHSMMSVGSMAIVALVQGASSLISTFQKRVEVVVPV